jgi:hypothetical protein
MARARGSRHAQLRVDSPLAGLVLREPVPAAIRMLCRDRTPRSSAGVVAAMKN